MNKHLPECPAGYVADLCTTDIDPVLQEPTCNHCVGQGCICICNRLRACEQRVLSLNPVALGVLIAQRARERALDAAEEAVRATLGDDERNLHAELTAIAAIDALRERP